MGCLIDIRFGAKKKTTNNSTIISVMELKYDFKERHFYCVSSYDERDIPKQAGFTWDNLKKGGIQPMSKKLKH